MNEIEGEGFDVDENEVKRIREELEQSKLQRPSKEIAKEIEVIKKEVED